MLHLAKVSDFALLEYFHRVVLVCVLMKDEKDFTVAAYSKILEQGEVLEACLMRSGLNLIDNVFITLF